VARPKTKTRRSNTEPGGLWHQPALLNLVADLLTVLAVAALVWAALTSLQRLPFFPLREIVLAAAPVQVAPAQIEHAARNAIVGNFFTIDLDAARQSFEKLPWVRKATVRRQWPDGLALTLEEHEAVARWQPSGKPLNSAAGDTRLVNRHGEIFSAELSGEAPRLPLLSGPDGSAPEMLRRRDGFDAVLATIGRQTATMSLSPRLAWRLKLDDGLSIELGRGREPDTLAERMARFVAHYEPAKTQLGLARSVDMRYPNGFVMSGIVRNDTRTTNAGAGSATRSPQTTQESRT
jgi:cell division protein FtsQ